MPRGPTNSFDGTTVSRSWATYEIKAFLPKKSSSAKNDWLFVEDDKLILLARLGKLRDAGLLSEEDFANEKERVLSRQPPAEKPTNNSQLVKQLWKEAPDWVPDPLIKIWPWPLITAVLLLVIALILWGSLTGSDGNSYERPSTMPNYVCWNLEEAKEDIAKIDSWVTNIDAVKNRGQTWDRNWTVVRQSPVPRAFINIDSDVTFWVARHDEVGVKWPNLC